MRRKPNLMPRLANCSEYIIPAADAHCGAWLEVFSDCNELRAELGCGKGRFLSETARANPRVLFIGIERVADAAVVAAERARDAGLRNVRFIIDDVACLPTVFAPRELSVIYINFCDPWQGKKRAKRRLTSDGYLALYKNALSPNGEIRFKTDNTELFDFSLERFDALGFTTGVVTRDLHRAGGDDDDTISPADTRLGEMRAVMTDYEEKFYSQGVRICACTAAPPRE
ncbi:MAG: tRNA (guanosine(46)-N7)-methyltransferase TrmB [Oscillospiraceae bacterium]|jgi:tRNA (guanine-N7-)-methyltransferase|nr:tRNA (guanosine(46)-N7)-methyltransferase TrmB [Oscillospiraceae bacterium]